MKSKIIVDIIDNRVNAFDSLFQPISSKIIEKKYSHYDTCVNDMCTRPRFVDNIYHPLVKAVLGYYLADGDEFDTITNSKSSDYLEYIETLYDQKTGNYIGNERAFLIRKNTIPSDSILVKEKFLQSKIFKNIDIQLFNNITNTEDNYWANSEIKYKNSSFEIDSCQALYRLTLKDNFEFEQSYNNKIFCTTSFMKPEIKFGLEGGYTPSDIYADIVQYCSIENKCGLWSVIDNNLVFFNILGREVLRFEIVSANKKFLKLKKGDYMIKLKKSQI